jgi:thioredoxin reductase (NADPH)
VAYRRIGVPSVEALLGRGVFYGSVAAEAAALAGEPVAVVGGGNSAAESAVHLARYASRVHMLVRGASLSESVSDYLVQQLRALSNVEILVGTEVVDAREPHRLRSLSIRDRGSGAVRELPVTALFLLIGAEPRTEWLPDEVARDERGFVIAGDPLSSGGTGDGRLPLETSMPGVFAVGDVRKGSVKRVAPAVGDGAAVSQQLMRYLSGASAREAQPYGR